jgi:deoxyribodipyrimidine photolyase-related protein
MVEERSELFGELRPFTWPVTHEEASEFFVDFLDKRLDCFGPYEDAIVERSRVLCHSLISPLLNVGLLDPLDVCRQVEARYQAGEVRINSAEGFIRQILGWREFVYQIYHHLMPDYLASNVFDADLALPAFYWTGDTSMRCVAEAVRNVRAYGINHHIQRLMITGNLALLLGVDPQAVNRWYMSAYVDAYEWVVTPNVLGLALFADGGMIATKPYAASANYINKMSDHCVHCDYDHKESIGTDACPFNALYWDFLARNVSILHNVPRMGLMLSLLGRKDADELRAIRRRADVLIDGIQAGIHF